MDTETTRNPRLQAVELGSEVLRTASLIAVILYAWRFGLALIQHFSDYIRMESSAIDFATGANSAVPVDPGGPTSPGGIFGQPASANAASWIFVCILAILYLVLIFSRWVARIMRIWASIRECAGFFGCLFRWISAIVETIAFVLVTIVSIMLVYINIAALL